MSALTTSMEPQSNGGPCSTLPCEGSMETWFFIKKIVCDDDASVRANLRHSWRALIAEGKMDEKDWSRTASNYCKKDHGQLPLYIPELTFLADPTHRIKVFAKYLFKLQSKPGSRCGKAEVLRMKRYMGYWLKQTRTLSFEEFQQASYAPLEHLFGNHTFCDVQWCPVKANRNTVKGKYHSKEENKEMYDDFHAIWKEFTNTERLKECWHPFESQINEALNLSVMCRAPKHKTYSTSMSLTNRVLITAGIHNLGYHSFWAKVFDELSMDMGESLEKCLHARDRMKQRKWQYKQTLRVKRRRSLQKMKQIVEYVKCCAKERKKPV